MNCEPIRGLLSAYLDDQLSASERQSVSAHLDICIECSAILSDYYRFDALLAQLPYLTPPSFQRQNITCQIPDRYRFKNGEDGSETVLTLIPLPLHGIDMPAYTFHQRYATRAIRPICTAHPLATPQPRVPARKNVKTNLTILLLLTTIGLLLIQYFYPKKYGR